jgi:type I restriction enzyme M protein
VARQGNGNGGPLGLEAKLWQAADALRNDMDAAEYKHFVLGLIFLNIFPTHSRPSTGSSKRRRIRAPIPEDPDEYRAAQIFWVPKEARWSFPKANAPQSTIGRLVEACCRKTTRGPAWISSGSRN